MERDTVASKIPVTLVTGFLGAGKTTLIGHLLRHLDMDRVAVVINELGEVGIDDDLVRMSSENVSLLENGCLCCAVRTDLQETLRELFGDMRAGRIPDFDRVIVETTGMADPGPVIQTLANDAMLGARYRLDGVVALVDAVNAPDQLEAHAEATQQVALADRILLTKTDLADAASVQGVRKLLREINPRTDIVECHNGVVHPQELKGLGLDSARAGPQTLHFLGELAGDAPRVDEPDYLGSRLTGRHTRGVKSFVLRFDRAFSWGSFTSAMELLVGLRGKDMLRVKGIVNVEGDPVVVQGVGHVFHPTVTLDRWPSADTNSRMVFITRNIDKAHVTALFESVRLLSADGSDAVSP